MDMVAAKYDALVLAGGLGTRMGGLDKGLVFWNSRPLIDHVLQRLKLQSPAPEHVFISANRHVATYEQRATTVQDVVRDYAGPLRGIQAGLMICQTDWMLVVPCDCPQLPADLAQRLLSCHGPAWAKSGDRDHYLCCMLPRHSLKTLEACLANGQRRVRDFLLAIGAVALEFEDADAFLNVNGPGS